MKKLIPFVITIFMILILNSTTIFGKIIDSSNLDNLSKYEDLLNFQNEFIMVNDGYYTSFPNTSFYHSVGDAYYNVDKYYAIITDFSGNYINYNGKVSSEEFHFELEDYYHIKDSSKINLKQGKYRLKIIKQDSKEIYSVTFNIVDAIITTNTPSIECNIGEEIHIPIDITVNGEKVKEKILDISYFITNQSINLLSHKEDVYGNINEITFKPYSALDSNILIHNSYQSLLSIPTSVFNKNNLDNIIKNAKTINVNSEVTTTFNEKNKYYKFTLYKPGGVSVDYSTDKCASYLLNDKGIPLSNSPNTNLYLTIGTYYLRLLPFDNKSTTFRLESHSSILPEIEELNGINHYNNGYDEICLRENGEYKLKLRDYSSSSHGTLIPNDEINMNWYFDNDYLEIDKENMTLKVKSLPKNHTENELDLFIETKGVSRHIKLILSNEKLAVLKLNTPYGDPYRGSLYIKGFASYEVNGQLLEVPYSDYIFKNSENLILDLPHIPHDSEVYNSQNIELKHFSFIIFPSKNEMEDMHIANTVLFDGTDAIRNSDPFLIDFGELSFQKAKSKIYTYKKGEKYYYINNLYFIVPIPYSEDKYKRIWPNTSEDVLYVAPIGDVYKNGYDDVLSNSLIVQSTYIWDNKLLKSEETVINFDKDKIVHLSPAPTQLTLNLKGKNGNQLPEPGFIDVSLKGFGKSNYIRNITMSTSYDTIEINGLKEGTLYQLQISLVSDRCSSLSVFTYDGEIKTRNIEFNSNLIRGRIIINEKNLHLPAEIIIRNEKKEFVANTFTNSYNKFHFLGLKLDGEYYIDIKPLTFNPKYTEKTLKRKFTSDQDIYNIEIKLTEDDK